MVRQYVTFALSLGFAASALSQPVPTGLHFVGQSMLAPAVTAASATNTSAKPAESSMDSVIVTDADSPVAALRGSARMLVIFSPDAGSQQAKDQLRYIEHHQTELTDRDTVVVPVMTSGITPETAFAGENLPADTARQELATRNMMHVGANEFAVVYLDMDGHEVFRSSTPLTMSELTSKIDSAEPKALRASWGR